MTLPQSAEWLTSWHSEAARGDDGPWSRWLPWAWQAVADIGARRPLPSRVGPDAELADITAYWGPLLHLTTYGLGWHDPARGLHAWLAAGAPRVDPRLELVHRWWSGDLPDLIAFAHLSHDVGQLGHHVRAELGLAASQKAAPPPAGLTELTVERRRDPTWQARWAGGDDPLHLAAHARTPLDHVSGGKARLAIGRPGHAVLIVDQYAGWYRALSQLGQTLPAQQAGRSWRVTVVCSPIGHLGTYRRSTTSGRRFAGRHRWHELGA